MMYKSANEWRNEADDFLYAWGYRGGENFPEYQDIKDVCHDLESDEELRNEMISVCGSVEIYAETLWCYVRQRRFA